jgi:hypothetical protein
MAAFVSLAIPKSLRQRPACRWFNWEVIPGCRREGLGRMKQGQKDSHCLDVELNWPLLQATDARSFQVFLRRLIEMLGRAVFLGEEKEKHVFIDFLPRWSRVAPQAITPTLLPPYTHTHPSWMLMPEYWASSILTLPLREAPRQVGTGTCHMLSWLSHQTSPVEIWSRQEQLQ